MKIINLRRRIAESLIAAGACIPISALAAPLDENLVANFSFEQTIPDIVGPFGSIGVADWISPNIVTTNNLSYAYSQGYTGEAPPNAGERYFWGRGTVKQVIDLAGASDRINAGNATYDLAAYFSSYNNDQDYSTITARFFGSGGNELESGQIGGQDFVKFIPTDDNNRVIWEQDFIDGTIPVGTTFVEIAVFPEVGVEKFFRDRGADGYVDLVEFSVTGFQRRENLVTNASFEVTIPELTGPFPHGSIGVGGWVSDPPEIETTNNLSYDYFEQGFAGDPVPDAGDRHFWGDGLVLQELDVSDGDTAVTIANGNANYNLSAFFSGYRAGGDHSTLSARFFDGQDALLDEVELGGFDFVAAIPLQPDGLKSWKQDSATGQVPAGTEKVEVAIFGHFAGGTTADGYVDLVQFSISAGALPGDCSGDGILDATDLGCVTTIAGRDAVLAALPSLPGDFDGDGSVAFGDFLVLSANFGSDAAGYNQGNTDLAGGVAFADFLILSANFGKTPAGAAAVPEPGFGVLFVSALIGFSGLRRGRGQTDVEQ